MVLKVATTGVQWSQPIFPHSASSSQTLASAISSPSSKSRRRGGAGALVYVQRVRRSALFGTTLTRLCRSQSCEHLKPKARRSIKRACSASLEDAFSDEEFSKKIQELALRFQLSDDGEDEDIGNDIDSEIFADIRDNFAVSCSDSDTSSLNFVQNQSVNPPSELHFVEPPWPEIRQEPPDWVEREDIVPASIERNANSVDLPHSLRIIKKKLQWKVSLREAGESAYCSVKKAFSSMVFIIRELHSYTLQMREILYYEDLQGILSRVQKEMHASFVWLFQQVFSHTPTLMVYVMILLANFTVYSMGHNAAIAAHSPPGSFTTTTEEVSVVEADDRSNQKFDSSAVKSFSVSSSGGKTTSIGGNNGGGGKVRPVSSGTEGDGGFNDSDRYRAVVPDGASQLSSLGTSEAESVSGQELREEELTIWNSIVEEASQLRDEALDQETVQKLVSPISVKIEPDNYEDYFRTELLYQAGLSQEPYNPLLLANYAQFLYLVAQDYDRAEEYFKKAIGVEPPDAEAFNKYATFLWRVRNDLWSAEETYLEAISADPGNTYYAANYAHFLWNTGGEDTCFPLTPPDDTQSS
ncbi:hypothetical protein UlMin_013219 [Ulmus minor]